LQTIPRLDTRSIVGNPNLSDHVDGWVLRLKYDWNRYRQDPEQHSGTPWSIHEQNREGVKYQFNHLSKDWQSPVFRQVTRVNDLVSANSESQGMRLNSTRCKSFMCHDLIVVFYQETSWSNVSGPNHLLELQIIVVKPHLSRDEDLNKAIAL
jgi:hypothetical protein